MDGMSERLIPSSIAVMREIKWQVEAMEKSVWHDEAGVAHPVISPFVRELVEEMDALANGRPWKPSDLSL